MFLGHFAVGFAAKKYAPRTSLGVLMAAPLLLDLIWPLMLLAGWEQVRIAPGNTVFTPLDFVSYPYTHSLATAIGWAVVVGGVYWLGTQYTPGALAILIGVLSHWVLDALTHRPDLPLYPGGPQVGLGLWNHWAATVVVELVLFAAGLWIYLGATRPSRLTGTYALGALVLFLLALFGGNALGPPPPSEQAIALAGCAMWLFPVWCAWIDRNRVEAGYY